jgi:hypothetical protein
MIQHHPGRFAKCVLAASLGAAFPIAAQAQSASEGWQWGATIYGWFPAIGGTTAFPATGSGPSIDVSSKQVIDALNFAFMGSLEGRKGQWGFWTDVVYADFGAGKSGSREVHVGHDELPVGVSADLNLDVKSWIWTAAGTYNFVAKPEYSADVLAGVRLLDLDQRLGWTFNGDIAGMPLPGRSGSATVKLSNWDAVVGVKGRANFGDQRQWFIPYYVDIGTGQSKFTWQAITGVGYEFGWGSVLATWRYLAYDFKSGSQIESVNFNGPTIGVAFRW